MDHPYNNSTFAEYDHTVLSLPMHNPKSHRLAKDDAQAVKAYHQTQSDHLRALINAAQRQQSSIPINNAGTGLAKPKQLVETGRKLSDESTGTTQRGSATTPEESGSGEGTGTGASSISEDIDEEDGEGELDDGRLLLTARPELITRLSQLKLPPMPPPHGVRSRSTSSSVSENPDNVPPTTCRRPSSREEEHELAWQAEGKRVWRKMPEGFSLRLDNDGKARRGSTDSGEKKSGLLAEQERIGLGIKIRSDAGNSRRRGTTAIQEGMDGLSLGRTPSRATSSVSVLDSSSFEGPAIASTSAFNPAQASSTANAHSRSFARPKDAPLRDALEEKEDYETKRLLRLSRKRGELENRIKIWSAGVIQHRATDSIPSIEPTPPSPRQSSPHYAPIPSVPPPAPLGGAVHTFSTRHQPLYLIPPTPDTENPPNLDTQDRATGFTGGVDLTARLRALEALMGPTPLPGTRTDSGLVFDKQVLDEWGTKGGDLTIKGRRSRTHAARQTEVFGGKTSVEQDRVDMTPRPASRGVIR